LQNTIQQPLQPRASWALVFRARAPNPKSSKSNILLLVYARAVLGHCSSKLAMDENLTWNPTWQKWIMIMGKFSSPSKMLNIDIFLLNYFF
jgi:hypothetical protein